MLGALAARFAVNLDNRCADAPTVSPMPGTRVVRFGLTWAQRRWFLYATLAFQALVAGDWVLNHGRLGGGVGTGLAGLLLLAMAVAMRFVGVSLTDKHAVVHAIPGMRIPWHDVHDVEVEHLLGVKTVVIHHGGGRRTRLNAPTTAPWGEDADFHAKVGVIRTFWARHRDSRALT